MRRFFKYRESPRFAVSYHMEKLAVHASFHVLQNGKGGFLTAILAV